MSTDSTVRPSPSRSSSFAVPSSDTCRRARLAASRGKAARIRSANPAGIRSR